MSPSPVEYEGTWEEIASHASEFAGRRLRLIVIEPESDVPDVLDGTIEQRLMGIAARIPAEEWSRLPTDLTDRLDDYIYGPDGT